MPLPRYGVAIGTYVSFVRDPQDQYGRWYHGHLTIDTPGGQFQSALDVDTPSEQESEVAARTDVRTASATARAPVKEGTTVARSR